MERTIGRPFLGHHMEQPTATQTLVTTLYKSIRQLQAARGPVSQEIGNVHDATAKIKVVCISDTHNTRPVLPDGDILLHAGDLSQYGTFDEIQAQLSWLDSQSHQHKIVIAGNHDLLLDSAFVTTHPDRELDFHDGKRRSDLKWGSLHYLEHNSVSLTLGSNQNRVVRIFGSPWTLKYGSWAFQEAAGSQDQMLRWKSAVPVNTDIMLVHGPPQNHLDGGGKGSRMLLDTIWRTRPRLVVFGHIHEGRGRKWIVYDRIEALRELANRANRAWMSALCLAVYFSVWKLLAWLRIGGPKAGREQTELVNAAVVGKHSGREITIVHI